MKLNYECIRDILLALEEHISINDDLSINPISSKDLYNSNENLSKYKFSEFVYCATKMDEAELINTVVYEYDDAIGEIMFYSISFVGHQYLDSIRSPKIWNLLKSNFSEKSISMTLDLILSQASKIALCFLS